MGNSASQLHPTYINIYKKIIQIQSPQTRLQMIETCLSGPEYVSAAKMAGIYSQLLAYVTHVRNGLQPPILPGEVSVQDKSRNGVPQHMMQPPQLTGHHGGTQRSQQNPYMHQQASQISMYEERQEPAWQQIIAAPQHKAMSYFSSCLSVLGINEEESLTEERLKQAYKRAAVRVHPDKGGSEQEFEAVTRAYAYLAEIMKRMQGRKVSDGPVSAPSVVAKERKKEMKGIWSDDTQPVTIDPKNMNMQMFNHMFEQARIPDPDDDGYGDWLKETQAEPISGPKFSGEFNRDVFNNTFQSHVTSQQKQQKQQIITHPQDMALTLSAGYGVELGREKPAEYTAAANEKTQYTDLRAAYTTRSTFSGEVANVRVENRDLKKYQAERDSAPAPLSNDEAAEIAAAEERWRRNESARVRRAAEEQAAANQQFERMKRLMIVNGTPVD